MQFASLGSGSRGNATVVAWGTGALLVECCFSIRETQACLARLALTPSDLSAMLVTHEHSDHIKAVAPLARRYNLPVYMTPGTYHARDFGELPDIRLVHGYAPFTLDGLVVTPVAVPHDAREPAQFVFVYDGLRLGVLTDLGSLTPHVDASFVARDAIPPESKS